MAKFKCETMYDDGVAKMGVKVIETPFTKLQWVKINFLGWGFYKVVKVAKDKYEVYDTFSNQLCYKIY